MMNKTGQVCHDFVLESQDKSDQNHDKSDQSQDESDQNYYKSDQICNNFVQNQLIFS